MKKGKKWKKEGTGQRTSFQVISLDNRVAFSPWFSTASFALQNISPM